MGEDFDKKIQQYHQAVQQEFDVIASGDVDAVIDQCRATILRNLTALTSELLDLAHNADSETVRLNAIKTAFDMTKDAEDGAGGIGNLLKQLTKQPAATDKADKADRAA